MSKCLSFNWIWTNQKECLQWIGNLLDYQNLGKLSCLEKAYIFLKHNGDDYEFDNAFEVLCSICRVTVLQLTEETTKVPAMVSLLKGMPHLNTLHIDSYPSLELIHKPKGLRANTGNPKTSILFLSLKRYQ
ncbi:uncharacterized protein LOC126794790 [Argentina anserina]|uniref:uncharacterized protein LOC126794790 n=1 Tax=Argentina anserina TaxID=57926 RepID=UPI0021763E13|nr:uncharacterized protein LOC126794790 [Potentilla anserina]